MKRSFKKFFLVLLLALSLGACISYQVQDAADAVMTAKYTLAGVNNSIAALATSGSLTKAQATTMAEQADKAAALITTASSLSTQGKPQDALSTLAAANAILLQLQKSLQAQQLASPGGK